MPKSLDRREFLRTSAKAGAAFTVLGGGGALLEACGGNGAAQTTTTVHDAANLFKTTPPAGAKLGGSVIFGTEAEESGMDPTYGHFDSTGVLYARCVFDPLAVVTDSGQVYPYLAESITPNSTYTAWRIKIRPNVLFHDGTKCDGAAMKYCMDAFFSSPLVNFALNYWTGKIDLIDSLTIQINMKYPWVSFPAWLCGYIGGQVAYMFSRAAYNLKGESYFSFHPVGTGPFYLVDWVPGSYFKCAKNPNYWLKDSLGRQLPYLDSWTYRPIPLVSTRLTELESNSIQMMHTDDDPTILLLEKEKDIGILLDSELQVGEPDCSMAMINTTKAPMNDVTLRKAAALAFDQERYCSVVGRNLIHPITGPFSPPSPYAGTTNWPAYDPNQAKALVTAWSQKHGGEVPTFTYTSTTAADPTTYELVQYMMEQAGFKVPTAQVVQADLISDALAKSYDVFSWRQFANIDPDLNYTFWTSYAGAVNFTGNHDPKIDRAMDTARQSTDQAVRKQAYQEVADRFAVDFPYIWAARDLWCVAARNNVQNWNNPIIPGQPSLRGLSMLSGIIMPSQVWLNSSS